MQIKILFLICIFVFAFQSVAAQIYEKIADDTNRLSESGKLRQTGRYQKNKQNRSGASSRSLQIHHDSGGGLR